MRMSAQSSTVTGISLLISSLFLASCEGVLGNSPEDESNGDDSPNDEDPDNEDLDDPRTCVPGIPSSTQIPRLLNREYDAVVEDLLGVTTLASAGDAAPSSLLVPDYDGSLTDIAWNSYLVAAKQIASQVISGSNRTHFISCDPAVAGCLSDTIRTFGRKAFRRPLTETEVASFERLNDLDPPGTPDEVAEAVLYAFLASPSFLLIPELSQELEADAIKLSQHEIAARLSFLLWGSVPDTTLAAAADAGELTDKEQVFAQAERMVQMQDQAAPIVAAFHRHYADIREGTHWASLDHDTSLYPGYSQDAMPSMMQELDRFFQAVAFGGGTFQDLFLSNIGFVNEDTAGLYGLDPSAFGSDLVQVDFPADQRPGFLTRVGFLSSFSGYSSTSPILRGAYVTERILGIEVQSPPPGATDTPVPPGDYQTNREVIEALTTPQPCGACHNTYINPPGFVLERYNAVGTWQETDVLGGAIDATADVYLTEDAATTISTPVGLMEGIAGATEARRRYAEAWVSFATGRAPNSNDACVVDELSTKLSNDGYSILSLLVDLTLADSFHLRTVAD